MGHTPGPWRITMGTYWLRIIGPSKQGITSFGNQRRWMNQKEVEANARRIVACVNACEGINPEAVPELLAACELVAYDMQSWKDGENLALDAVRAAIAKAKRQP